MSIIKLALYVLIYFINIVRCKKIYIQKQCTLDTWFAWTTRH